MNTNLRIVIATHELVYGVPHALKDYLIKKKYSHLLFISLPFSESHKTSYVLYENGIKIEEKIHIRNKKLGILDFFIDFFQIIFWVYKSSNTWDVFIGINNLNSLAGLVLKKLGKVKKVIFYTMDFVPIRFNNRILNYIFHQIEMICVKKCDETWNVSPRMARGREKYLDLPQKKYPQKWIPVGTWNNNIVKRKLEEIKKKQILFIGHILEKQGIQEVIEALPKIIKEVGEVRFVIIGGGDYEPILKKRVNELNLEKNVEFLGWFLNRKKIDETIGESAIAVATYKPEKEWLHNFTYYADPYKIKDYLSAGLPIIMTNVSYNVKDVEKNGCGIIVDYDKDDIAKAIIKLIKDERMFKKYRNNCLQYMKNYDWELIFDRVFKN